MPNGVLMVRLRSAIVVQKPLIKKLNQTTGVASATVDFESKTAWVIYDAKVMGLEKISEVVKATGPSYKVTSIEQVQSLKP